ncbi:MAG: hypothetical protein RLZ79_81 [Pseudomonadota bacterium]|jgi:hypothetical protein
MLTARSVDGWLIGTILAFCSLADPVSAASRSEAVVVNGVPLRLRSTSEFGEPEVLAELLAHRWAQNGPAPLTIRLRDGRIILGRQRQAFHETVSLQRGRSPGSTRIEYAIRDLREPIEPWGTEPFVVPADWQRISAIRHGRSRGAPLTLLYRSHRTVATAIRQLRESLLRAGWSATRVDSDNHAVLMSRRGNRQLQAAIARSETGVRIVIQLDGSEQ